MQPAVGKWKAAPESTDREKPQKRAKTVKALSELWLETGTELGPENAEAVPRTLGRLLPEGRRRS